MIDVPAAVIEHPDPECFADECHESGKIYLRGLVGLGPVPAFGPSLLAVFPADINGVCVCTPQFQDVVTTTTGLAFPNASISCLKCALSGC